MIFNRKHPKNLLLTKLFTGVYKHAFLIIALRIMRYNVNITAIYFVLNNNDFSGSEYLKRQKRVIKSLDMCFYGYSCFLQRFFRNLWFYTLHAIDPGNIRLCISIEALYISKLVQLESN